MRCPKCAETIPDDAEYCPFCGAEIRTESAAPKAEPPPQAPQTPPTAPPAAQPAAPQRSQWSVCLVIGCVVVFLVVAVLGIGGYFIWQKLRPAPPEPAPQSSTTTVASGEDEPPPSAADTDAPDPIDTGLDDLAGVWDVEVAVLDGPPPETLTFALQGDTAVGTLSERINTRLELRAVDGRLQGAYFDPNVVEMPAYAKLVEGDRLDVYGETLPDEWELFIQAIRGDGP